MKLKANLFLLAAFILFSTLVNAEVIVYRTYNDFVNKKGEHYDDYRQLDGQTSMKLDLLKDGKKVKVPCKDIWGFIYNDVLFRIDHYNGNAKIPYRVLSANKIVYYETGMAHLEMIKKGKSSGDVEFGHIWLLSTDINSEMVPGSKKDKKALVAVNSDYQSLFDCYESDSKASMRDCVFEFNRE